MEFICSGCQNACRLSYTMQNGAMIPGEGQLCPKGMLGLIKAHLPISKKLKEAKEEQVKSE